MSWALIVAAAFVVSAGAPAQELPSIDLSQPFPVEAPSAAADDDVPGLAAYPLTAEQRQRIADIRRQGEERVREARSDSTLSAQQMAAREFQINRETHDQVMAVLTPEQQAEFADWWRARTGEAASDQPTRIVAAVRPEAPAETRIMAAPEPEAPLPEAPLVGSTVPAPPEAYPGLAGLVQNPLTDDQRSRIVAIQQRTQAMIASIRSNPSISEQQKTDMIAQVTRGERGQIVAVLTPEQREEFESYWGRIGSTPAGTGAGPAEATAGVLGLQNNPLTVDQQTCIAMIRDQTASRLQAIQSNTMLTDQQRREFTAQVRASEREQVMQVLTSRQREEFRDYWGVGASTGAGVGAGPTTAAPVAPAVPSPTPPATTVPGTGTQPEGGIVQPPVRDVGPGLL